MKIIGIILFIVGSLALLIAGLAGIAGPSWETAGCAPLENATKEADDAAKLLAQVKEDRYAKGTSIERGIQQISDEKERSRKIALKNCEDARSQRSIVFYSSLAGASVGGLLLLLGMVALAAGRRMRSV